jgi:hypothetical protein
MGSNLLVVGSILIKEPRIILMKKSYLLVVGKMLIKVPRTILI